MPLPSWMDTTNARANRADGLNDICAQCQLPFWACQAAFDEALRLGLVGRRERLDAEARAALTKED